MTDLKRTHPNVIKQGADLADATATIILIHGRGATADSIIRLADALDPEARHPIAWIAPQADGNSWYPYPFLEGIETNEPHRTTALQTIDGLIQRATDAGIPLEKIGLIGFSQGACLVLEYAGWGGQQPGFVGALSGGVMGPLDLERSITGDRTGIRVFIGCGDRDGHIPLAHAERSARLLEGAGATVDYRAYLGFSHAINDNEIEALRAAVTRLVDTDT
jgi:predicted esterase